MSKEKEVTSFHSGDRSRAQADHISSFFNDTSVETPGYKQRLYELFSQIDKEFETLYLENCQLKIRLGQAPENSLNDFIKSPDTSTSIFNEIKAAQKKYRQQKWKSAFRRPPQRFVPSLKVGSGQNSDSSKHSFVRSFEGHQDAVLALATSSFNGHALVASASADQSARIFCPDSGECLFQYDGHNGAVNSISLMPDISTNDQFFVLTASGDRTVHLWKTSSLNESSQPNNSSEDDLDATSEKLIDNEDEHVGPASVVIRQPLRVFSGHSDAVVGAEFLQGGEQLITVSWDRTANIYDMENETVVNVLTGHDSELTFCSSHKTNKIVATASRDHTFRLWDFRETMRSVAVFQGHNAAVNSVVFAANHHIISGSDDRTVKVWDLRNMRCAIASSRFDSGVNKVGASTKSRLMAIPLDNRHVYIHDLNGNRIGRLHRGNSHTALVTSAIWSDETDSTNLITASIDKKMFGWRVNVKS
ncbi:unnamed protein product [Bursaphelenchus xylophilus]|uniref:WD repeat-containing protein 37 n=1 Tax=Bursaphelenchus xylophilus TaxID=6326 RepID=A0A1I7RYZ5_BURXY|nr:unnamed protein product [Bursaphelenchus xylophilus]CAG9107006.1 unnamed protein product [Bursaphelenchus xylophilus]